MPPLRPKPAAQLAARRAELAAPQPKTLQPGRNEPANANNTAVELAAGRRFSTKQTRRTFENLARVARAADQLAKLPEPNESIHLVLRGDFNAWDLVPAVLRLVETPLAVLRVATLGFKQSNTDELLALLDARQIHAAAFLCSHYYAAHHRDACERLARELAARGQKFAATRSHAKILLFQTAERRPRYYVSESSANLRSCRNVEQLTLYQSRELFEFHSEWILELIHAANQ